MSRCWSVPVSPRQAFSPPSFGGLRLDPERGQAREPGPQKNFKTKTQLMKQVINLLIAWIETRSTALAGAIFTRTRKTPAIRDAHFDCRADVTRSGTAI